MLSVIIPSYYDPFLQKTVNSLLKSARGEIEIIAVQDGPVGKLPIKADKRVKLIVLPQNKGMRGAINAGIAKARGEFIMKCDAHCIFGSGFDKILTENCGVNQLMIPRRYSLNQVHWRRDLGRPVRDYHYLTYPGLTPQDWLQGPEKHDPRYNIDDTMTFQGSCWFANKKYFIKRVGYLDDRREAYGPFGGEQVEIGLKYWLGGGEVKVNKKTWYAHLVKRPYHYATGLFTRSYKSSRVVAANRAWLAKHWVGNQEPGMIHPISWLVEKFWPVPSWPENRLKWEYPK